MLYPTELQARHGPTLAAVASLSFCVDDVLNDAVNGRTTTGLAPRMLAMMLMRPAEFRQIRAYLHMSHRTLARQLSVTADVIARWESGREAVPDLVDLVMNALLRQTRQRRRAS